MTKLATFFFFLLSIFTVSFADELTPPAEETILVEEIAVIVEQPELFAETSHVAVEAVIEQPILTEESVAEVEQPVVFAEAEQPILTEESVAEVEQPIVFAEEEQPILTEEAVAEVEQPILTEEAYAEVEQPVVVAEPEQPILIEESVIEVEAPIAIQDPFAEVGLAVLEDVEVNKAQIICEEESLLDEEIEVAVVGLKPNQVVVIEASSIKGDNVQWISSAQFRADQNGVINVSKQAPLQGSYEGVDSMGLFWSMKMGNVLIGENGKVGTVDCRGALQIDLRVLDENEVIAEKTICRHTLKADVEVIELRENGLIGDLFIPNSEEALPVVIVLAGSEGGIPSGIAELLSSNGIAAFALAYSGVSELPPYVENVHLEYFEKAFEWLQNHPRLNGKISLWGGSRGGELALLLGSMFPEAIDRIVAVAPSSVVLSTNAWLYKGEPVLPAAPFFVDFNYDFRNDFALRETPHVQKIHLERGIYCENERFEAASIPVEKIQCPIMLITGGDDQLGPSSFYAKLIFARLEKFHSKIEKIHLDYPKAGHLISIPYIPRVNLFFDTWRWINVGGTPFADELASRDAWQHTLEFLGNYTQVGR